MLKCYLLSLFFITSILLVSCSSIPKSDFQNHYYSPDYENKSYKNVSMDICYPKTDYESGKADYKYNSELDSSIISMMSEFQSAFLEYFPDGVKMFSSTINTGWIFYELNTENFPIMYDKQSNGGTYLYSVSMPDSLTFFQKQSNSDFLFVLHNSTVITSLPNQINPKAKYSTTIELQYSLWDRKTLDLLATDRVISKIEFKKSVDKWPFRSAIMKTAALIFEKLPMFQK